MLRKAGAKTTKRNDQKHDVSMVGMASIFFIVKVTPVVDKLTRKIDYLVRVRRTREIRGTLGTLPNGTTLTRPHYAALVV